MATYTMTVLGWRRTADSFEDMALDAEDENYHELCSRYYEARDEIEAAIAGKPDDELVTIIIVGLGAGDVDD